MTLPDLLLICGVAVLGAALRTVSHPLAHRLSLLCLVIISYLFGYFLSGSVIVGLILAGSWGLLPWLELLTRVRRIRLPLEKSLEPSRPPNGEEFPGFRELSEEFESEGFKPADDLAWDWAEQRQFYRFFVHESEPVQGAICLMEHSALSFFYISLSSRTPDGTHWTTWNYPFAYTLKTPPHLRLNRLRGDTGIFEMLEEHRDFLHCNGVGAAALQVPDPEQFAEEMQRDLRLQIAHNLQAGVLRRNGEGEVLYSWRGLFYLWVQLLRDLVRFS